jgi:hypothetical protein
VAHRQQREPEGRARTSLEWQHRVRGVAREEGARPFLAKSLPGERRSAFECCDRTRDAERAAGTGEAQVGDRGTGLEQRPQGLAVCVRVPSELVGRLVERTLEHDGAAVVEGMRKGCVGVHPVEVEVPERGRGDRQRMDRRADVVHEPGSVSSAERRPPPASSAASCTSTARPARASSIAATRPFGPDPITTARRATRSH